MIGANLEPVSAAMERLLAYERKLVPASAELRARSSLRARAALRGADQPVAHAFGPRRRLSLLLAATFVLALGAAAFAAWQGGLLASGPPAGHVAPAGKPEVAERVAPVRSVDTAPVLAPELVSRGAATAGEAVADDKRSVVVAARPSAERDLDALELEMLQRARRALSNAEFSTALAEAAEHQRRFPAGRLREEREALRVKALLGLGRIGEARAAAERFRKQYPRSVLAPRIDEAIQ